LLDDTALSGTDSGEAQCRRRFIAISKGSTQRGFDQEARRPNWMFTPLMFILYVSILALTIYRWQAIASDH
jgi:hypothetical protein